ncbi:hypothetical protein EDD16DRAFT_1702467 [Pisolithus croceorrhizus]|nr:hypothetical protein EDD16DRAFT_1702467 [Pisolithus croceorrhizus]
MSSSIGEPFQLYSTNTSAKKFSHNSRPVYTTYNPKFRKHVTLTIQGDGIHVVDLENLHSVVSHSVGDHVSFSAPAFSRSIAEGDDTRFSVTYAVIKQAPEVVKANRERTIWIMKQTLTGLRVAKDERKSVVAPFPPMRICGVDSDKLPLLLVSKSGGISLADPEVTIKSQLEWTGERELLDVFIFSPSSCPFIRRDMDSVRNVVCICCQAGSNLYVRVALVGEEIVHVDTCELPIGSEGETVDGRIAGVTCSVEGILSFVTSRGVWKAFQLSVSEPSSLLATPLSEPLQLHRFSALKKKRPGNPGISVVSFSSSLVLLAATVDGQNISLQLWDLRYGVLLASQTLTSPMADALSHFHLTLAHEGQALLTLSPSQLPPKSQGSARSTVHAIPFDQTLKSNLAAALGKSSATEEWLAPPKSDPLRSVLSEDRVKLLSAIKSSISKQAPQRADDAFFTWIKSNSGRDTAEPSFEHEFVKRIVNTILLSDFKAGDQYSPRIIQYLLERGLVSAMMVDGILLRRLYERGDWENVILSLRSVVDVSEDEMMSSLKFVIDEHRKRENKTSDAMEVDLSESWIPPLETILSACLSYDFSPVTARLSIRRHLSDARDLVTILGVLEGWLHGGTEDETKLALMSTAKIVDMTTESRSTITPPYPKVVTFLQTLLDASCITLLQYRPSYDLLRQILAQIEPEIDRLDRLEQLRGVLEPFAKAHARISREKAGCVPQESQAESKRRRKQLEQQASLEVGLYRLEELWDLDDKIARYLQLLQSLAMSFSAGVITVSDSVHAGVNEDKSGALIQDTLRPRGFQRVVSAVAPDDEESIRARLKQILSLQAISPLLERQAPGLVHLLLSSSLKHTPLAALSRPVAGTIGKTLVVTLPGSTKAVRENLDALLSNGVLDHALDLIKGGSGKAVHAALGSGHTPAGQGQAHGHHHHSGCVAPKPRTALSHDPSIPAPGRLRVSPYPLIGLEDALDIIMTEVQPLGIVTLPVTANLAGHVLAEDVYAPEDIPSSKTTNVDGYAVRSSDTPGVYKVLTSLTHKLFNDLPKGSIFRINTGGPLPTGTDSVIMVEDTELESAQKDADGEDMEEEQVKTLAQVSPGDNVRQPGSDVRKGELVMQMGEVITSAGGEVGTLAFVGRKEVKVVRKPVVALLSTGNELLDLQSPKPIPGDGWGGIWDTNRPSLQAALEGMGYKVVDLGIASDDVDAHIRAISKGLETADILLTTGGTSMGAGDLLKPVIERRFNGTIHFGRVAMKPGKPTTFASIPTKAAIHGRKLLFALPGNPASAIVTFHIFVVPALRRLGAWLTSKCQLPRVEVQLQDTMPLDSRVEFHRVIVRSTPDGLLATTTGSQRSSRMTSLCGANGLVQLPPLAVGGPSKLEAGEFAPAVVIGEIQM